MDVKDLKVLIKMITETDITEFEMDSSDEKIVIKRGSKTEYVTMAAPTAYAMPQAMQAPVAAAPGAGSSAAPEKPSIHRSWAHFTAPRRLMPLRMWKLGRWWRRGRCSAL